MLLRPVPGRSVVHELWAGTKLLVAFGVSVLLTLYPGWVTIGLVAALVAAGAWLAHIPRGVLPSVPRWLPALLVIVGITAALAGGSPQIHVGTVTLGLGGLLEFLRFTALSVVLLGTGALVSWTTAIRHLFLPCTWFAEFTYCCFADRHSGTDIAYRADSPRPGRCTKPGPILPSGGARLAMVWS